MKIWKCVNIFLKDAFKNLQSTISAKYRLRRFFYFWISKTYVFSLVITFFFHVDYVSDANNLS